MTVILYVIFLPSFEYDYDEEFFYQADKREIIPDEKNIDYYLFLLFHDDNRKIYNQDAFELYNIENKNIDAKVLKMIEDIRTSEFNNRQLNHDYSYQYHICQRISADFCKYIPEDIDSKVKQPDRESIKKLNEIILYINTNTQGYQSISRDLIYGSGKIKNLFYQGVYYSLYEIENGNVEAGLETYKQYYIFFHKLLKSDSIQGILPARVILEDFYVFAEIILDTYSIDSNYFEFFKDYQIDADNIMKDFILGEYLDLKELLDNSGFAGSENILLDYSDLMEKYKGYLYGKYTSEKNLLDSRDFYHKNILGYMFKYNSIGYYLYFTGSVDFSGYREDFQLLENKRLQFIQKYLEK